VGKPWWYCDHPRSWCRHEYLPRPEPEEHRPGRHRSRRTPEPLPKLAPAPMPYGSGGIQQQNRRERKLIAGMAERNRTSAELLAASLRQSHAPEQVAIARVRAQIVEEGPGARKNQVVLAALVSLLEPRKRAVFVVQLGIDHRNQPR
jgi:hypothetical protein